MRKKGSFRYLPVAAPLLVAAALGACTHGGPSRVTGDENRARAMERLGARISANEVPAERPGFLLRLGELALEQARATTGEGEQQTLDGTFEEWGGYCPLAMRSFEEIVRVHPESPEAPEALLALGRAYDSCRPNEPEIAEAYYRKVVSSYPWSTAAREASFKLENSTADPMVAPRP